MSGNARTTEERIASGKYVRSMIVSRIWPRSATKRPSPAKQGVYRKDLPHSKSPDRFHRFHRIHPFHGGSDRLAGHSSPPFITKDVKDVLYRHGRRVVERPQDRLRSWTRNEAFRQVEFRLFRLFRRSCFDSTAEWTILALTCAPLSSLKAHKRDLFGLATGHAVGAVWAVRRADRQRVFRMCDVVRFSLEFPSSLRYSKQ
jgi:hypothetical protein